MNILRKPKKKKNLKTTKIRKIIVFIFETSRFIQY